jgi:hypothetical protein
LKRGAFVLFVSRTTAKPRPSIEQQKNYHILY